MPQATVRFHVAIDPPELRTRLSDPSFIARSIPPVVAVERTSDTTALWTVEIKLGPLVHRSVFQGALLAATNDEVRFRATGAEATIEGVVTFHPSNAGGTDVGLTLTMAGAGPLRSIVDAYLARRFQTDTARFAADLARRLDKPAGPPGDRGLGPA